jgi:transcriptional regulator with XRE-family HTH domain
VAAPRRPLPQVAANIRTARAALGISQELLARRLDVSVGTVGNWEAGRSRPMWDNLDALCEALCVSASWLLEDHTPNGLAA